MLHAGVDLNDPSLQALLYYRNQTANFTYYLNLQPLSFMAAESFCKDRGAHLVSYMHAGEQLEVEKVGVEGRSSRCPSVLPWQFRRAIRQQPAAPFAL